MIDRERGILTFIWITYGKFITAAAALRNHRPEVIAGIVMRESEGGLSKLLKDEFGNPTTGPAGIGDNGHGYGLGQIDSRSFPEFIVSGDWKDAKKNIFKIAAILALKRIYLRATLVDRDIAQGEFERLSIIAYNLGEGNTRKAVELGTNPDTLTAHGNYGCEVLRLAEIYKDVRAETTMQATT